MKRIGIMLGAVVALTGAVGYMSLAPARADGAAACSLGAHSLQDIATGV